MLIEVTVFPSPNHCSRGPAAAAVRMLDNLGADHPVLLGRLVVVLLEGDQDGGPAGRAGDAAPPAPLQAVTRQKLLRGPP